VQFTFHYFTLALERIMWPTRPDLMGPKRGIRASRKLQI